jgi:uncharacterized protein with beta-barrel porin domain
MFAQSIGGGGGFVGGQAGDVTLGGSAGGAGGAVSVLSAASVTTTGFSALGLVAQSIGGGGGVAIGSGAAQFGTGSSDVGDGGTVNVTKTGTIQTSGISAFGILAQSIGGGGGAVLAANTTSGSLGTTLGGTGDGGAVAVRVDGSVITTGANAHAIVAQSIGGGGGLASVNGLATPVVANGTGIAGNVSILVNGTVAAFGDNASAILAQSEGATSNGTITITTGVSSTLIGGLNVGAVAFRAGSTNALINNGTISSADGLAGTAITGTTGNETITNNGMIIGNVLLGTGTSTFNNEVGAAYYAGPMTDLGGAGLLNNQGLFAPGGAVSLMAARLEGSFVQSGAGTMDITLDQKLRATDSVTVSGTASVGGTLQIGVIQANYAKSGSWTNLIVATEQGLDPNTRPALAYAPSAVASYSVIDPDGYNLYLATTVNWVPAGLNWNQTQVATMVNTLQSAGSTSAFAPVSSGLYAQPTLAAYGSALSKLSGEGIASTQTVALTAGGLFAVSMLDQANLWRQNSGIDVNGITDKFVRDGGGDDLTRSTFYGDRTWRLWATPASGYGTQGGNNSVGSATFSQRGYGLSAGLDIQENRELLFGVAVSGSSNRFSVPQRATTGTVNSGFAGVYAMKQRDDFYASGTLFGGIQKSDTQRVISGVMGYRLKAGWMSVVPFAAFQPSTYWQLRERERSTTGLGTQGAAGLNFDPVSASSLPVFLGAHFETEFAMKDGSVMVPYVRLAWMHDFTPSRSINAGFVAAPGYSFTVLGASQQRDALVVRSGAQLKITELLRLFGSFDGIFGPRGTSLAGTAGIQMAW